LSILENIKHVNIPNLDGDEKTLIHYCAGSILTSQHILTTGKALKACQFFVAFQLKFYVNCQLIALEIYKQIQQQLF